MAVEYLLVFLDPNGWEFDQEDDDIASAFEALGSREMDQQQFFAWVAANAVLTEGEVEFT